MKKTLSILLMLVMALSLMTGCTPDELSYLGLSQEINNLDAYTMSGTMKWDADLENLLAAADSTVLEAPASQEEIVRLIEKEGLKNITYTMSVNMKKNAMSASYSAGKNKLFTFVLLNNTFYLNADGLLELIQRNDTEAVQNSAAYEKLAAIKGKYLSITADELVSTGMFPEGALPPAQLKDMLSKRQQLNRNIMTYFMDYVKNDLSGYTTGLLKKSYSSSLGADVYQINASLDQMPLVGMDFLMVVLDHLDGTERFLLKVVNDPLMAEQVGEDAATLNTQIKSGFEELRAELDTTRQTLATALAEEKASKTYGNQIKSMVGDITFRSDLAKLSTGKYYNSVAVNYKAANPFNGFQWLTFTMDATVDGSGEPVIAAPGSTVSFVSFNSTLPHTLVLEPDYDSATYTPGLLGDKYLDAAMFNINGYWYVDLAALPAPFAGLVAQSGGQYTLGGQPLEASDIHQGGGKTLIAVKAFKKAGVVITWDEEFRTITLEK